MKELINKILNNETVIEAMQVVFILFAVIYLFVTAILLFSEGPEGEPTLANLAGLLMLIIGVLFVKFAMLKND